MELTPRERDKLLIFTAALLAERRRARGLKLNYPEAVAFITATLMEGARDDTRAGKTGRHVKRFDVVADDGADYRAMAPSELAGELKKLEAQMFKHAQDLEFEQAAQVRDRIQKIKAASLIG